MDRSTLHLARVITPGIMTLLLVLTVIDPSIALISTVEAMDFGGLSGVGVAVLVIGALYTLCDARYRVTGFSFGSIQTNIADRLLDIVRRARVVSAEEEQFLRNKRRLMDIFYRLLDNDESLKSRQEGVRLNGLFVTSVLDLSVMSLAGWGIHAGAAMWRGSYAHVVASTACFMLWVVATAIFMPVVMRRHRSLSDEQLDFIETHHRTELRRSVDEALSGMP